MNKIFKIDHEPEEELQICPKTGALLIKTKSDKLESDKINPDFLPCKSSLDLNTKMHRVLSCADEVVKPIEFMALLKAKEHFVCYDGFEPSGRMHIAQGLLKKNIVNKLTEAGGIFVFWIADLFALMNNKMGGNLDNIRLVGSQFTEIWKTVGMNMSNVRFLWCSELINKHSEQYYSMVIDIASRNSLSRMKRCATIMGRDESDDLKTSQLMQPAMQCTDIFFLGADVCQLGLDQRKVNMLAREQAGDIKLKTKPIILSHPMMPGLKQGQEKMSKSDPDSAIFMEDSAEEVAKKITKAQCAPGEVKGNPVMEQTKQIVYGQDDQLRINNLDQVNFKDLENDYSQDKVSPKELKTVLIEKLNAQLKPVREHFENDEAARLLLEKVKVLRTTK